MSKKQPTYSVGLLVEHPQRPEWGPGRVVAVGDQRIYVFFRDSMENKARVILTDLIALRVCETQTDEVLDALAAPKFDGQDWVLSKPKRTPAPAGTSRRKARPVPAGA